MESAIGYVQNLSPVKVGSKRKISYFEFTLQTGCEQYTRAVCFHESLRATLESYQDSVTPVKLRNISRRPNWNDPTKIDVVVNNRSVVETAPPSEVNFEGQSTAENGDAPEYLVDDIRAVRAGQKLTVRGRLAMNVDEARSVQINGGTKRVLDTSTLTDNTGCIRLTLWEDNLTRLVHGLCYTFIGVRVKEIGGRKILTTTPTTTVAEIAEDFPLPDEGAQDTRKTLLVHQIDMLSNYSSWFICKNCKKMLTEVSTVPIVKCRCGTTLLVRSCPKGVSIRIAVADPDGTNPLWLTVFQNELEMMLRGRDENLSALSTEEEITSALLDLQELVIQYDDDTRIVNGVSF